MKFRKLKIIPRSILRRWMRFVRWARMHRIRKSPRRSAANFSRNCIGGRGRGIPSTWFATTTVERQRFGEIWKDYGFESDAGVVDASGGAEPRFYSRRIEAGGRDGRGNFWALQGAASAPP